MEIVLTSGSVCLLKKKLYLLKTMSFEYFEADSHVSTYNRFRPDPPKKLIRRIVEYTSEKFSEPLELAVDVGCGSGQSTEVLAPFFKKVLGLDSSPQIIQEAIKKCQNPNVFYSASPGEKMELEDRTANLVTACQALHWFDIPKFYSEAERILMPNGVLAVYGYNLPVPIYKNNVEIEKIVKKYYKDILGSYTLPQSRKAYLDNYTTKEFTEVYFVEGGKMQREENFMLETEGTINDLAGYISSWSAYQNYSKQMGEEKGNLILESFKNEFKQILQQNDDSSDKFKIRFNYFLLLGRKNNVFL